MLLELYLGMSRVDLAEKQLKAMKGIDEDSVLSMLASAQLMMAPVNNTFDPAFIWYPYMHFIVGIFKVPRRRVHLRRIDRQIRWVASLTQRTCSGQDASRTF